MATLCASGAVTRKAGNGYNATYWINSKIIEEIEEAEGEIAAVTRYDWVDNYGGISADVKKVLQKTCACLAAIQVITYDMSSYNSRVEAEDLINVNRDTALRGLSVLRDKKSQRFIQGDT